MNKLAKGLGSTTDEFKTFLRATGKRAEDTGPEVFNDASQEFDASDLKDQQLYVELEARNGEMQVKAEQNLLQRRFKSIK